MEENIKAFTITKENREAFGFTGYTKELVIPEFFVGDGKNDTIKGQTYQVTEIGFSAFGDCVNLQKVVLPDSVVQIHQYAFANNYRLENINFSKNLQEIETYAFYGTKLRDIHLQKKLKRISANAFSHCKYLETVNTSKAKKLKEIHTEAFSHCPQLKAFEIPENMKYLANFAFYDTPLNRMDSKSPAYQSIQNGQLLIDTEQRSVVWASTQSKDLVLPPEINEINFGVFLGKTYVFVPKTAQKIAQYSVDLSAVDLSDGAAIIIDKPKDSIPDAPWGAKNAHIYWIG